MQILCFFTIYEKEKKVEKHQILYIWVLLIKKYSDQLTQKFRNST